MKGSTSSPVWPSLTKRRRKREAREVHRSSKVARSLVGLKAKLHNRKRHIAKIQMKKQIKQHEQRNVSRSDPTPSTDGAVPTYLLDRAQEKTAKQLSSMVKQKRKEAAARFSVPLPKVRGMAEEEVFKVLKTGKSKGKSWKRVITKPTFVGEGFTRRPVKVRTVEYIVELSVDGTIYPADGFEDEEGARYTSRVGCHCAMSDYRSEKEPKQSDVYSTWCAHTRGNIDPMRILLILDDN